MKFENEMGLRGKNLTGNELINSKYHDAIIMVRTIETHKDEIIRDPKIEIEKLHGSDKDAKQKILKHIYDKYCATVIHYEKLSLIVINALKLCFKDIDYTIVVNTIKQRKELTEYQKWTIDIIEMNHRDLKTFNYDESLINDILFRLKEFGIECTKW